MIATPISAAMRPYSMAVAPSSFFRKRFNIILSVVECSSPARRERRTRHPNQTPGEHTGEWVTEAPQKEGKDCANHIGLLRSVSAYSSAANSLRFSDAATIGA